MDDIPSYLYIILLVLITLSMLFSISESSFLGMNKLRLRLKRKNKDKKAFNGDFGLTVRHCICEKYKVPQSEGTKKYFKKTVNAKYKKDIDEQLDEIFGKIKKYPFEYIQQRRQEKNFYNFKLRTSPRGRKIETISIRTNKKGASVAPRITGQLMLDPFNSFFCDIVGRKADRRSDVKAIIYENIDAMIQYFVQYMFTSDYNCWLYYEDGSLHKDLKKWKDVQNFELPEGTLKFGKKNGNSQVAQLRFYVRNCIE